METFKKLVLKCKKNCEDTLDSIAHGEICEATADQINSVILPEMEELLKITSPKELPPPEERYLLSFAYAFRVWEWDMQNPTELYQNLTKLSHMYNEL